jgi:uncharacterized protein (DUF3084 family)
MSRKDIVTSLQEEVLQLREQLSLVKSQLASPTKATFIPQNEVQGDTGSPAVGYGPFFMAAGDDTEARAHQAALTKIEALVQAEESLHAEQDVAQRKISELQEKLRKSQEEAQALKTKIASIDDRGASIAEREAALDKREGEIRELVRSNKALKRSNEKLLQREAYLMKDNKVLMERISRCHEVTTVSAQNQHSNQLRRCMDLANMNHQLLQDLYQSRCPTIGKDKDGGSVSDRSTDASTISSSGSHDHSTSPSLASPLTSSSSSFVSSHDAYYQAEDATMSPWLRQFDDGR